MYRPNRERERESATNVFFDVEIRIGSVMRFNHGEITIL